MQESSASPGRGTPDFGKFYKTTYMELKDGYKRGPSINADTSEKLPQHFHRPGKCGMSFMGWIDPMVAQLRVRSQ